MESELISNSTPPVLCDCCENINFHTTTPIESGLLNERHIRHQQNLKSLQDSARSCPGCQFIVEKIFKIQNRTEYPSEDSRDPITIELPQPDSVANPNLSPGRSLTSLNFWCPWPSEKHPKAALLEHADIYAEEQSAAAKSGIVMGRPIYNADDGRNPQNWLLHCAQNHPLCIVDDAQNEEGPELPTRVLDVGSDNNSKDPVLFITRGAHGRYVALSHRWGGSNISKTTSSNFEKQTQCIPLQSLNQTFQDAITITKKLGFRYLWIDSLCIIQDSQEDWQFEAGRMALVYGRSDLTLSATWANSGDSGLFYPRKPLDTIKFPYKNKHGYVDGEWFLKPGAAYMFERDVLESPLNSRGWVLQERLLSKRILHFCKNQLYWECKSSIWKETTGTLNLGLAGNHIAQVRKALVRTKSPIVYHTVQKQTSLYDAWYMVIEDYSQRSLTVAEDRLPAISGIVSAFQSEDTGRNIWGLWVGDFIRGLLWSIEYDVKDLKRLIAPSWSWAAWSAPVHSRLSLATKVQIKARVTKIEDELINTSPKQQDIPGKRVHIEGPTKEVSTFKYSKGWTNWDTNCLLYDNKGAYVGAGSLDSPSWFSRSSKPPKEMLALMLYTDDPTTPFPRDTFDGEFPHTYCLLLEKLHGGIYQRVGFAETSTNEFDNAPSREVAII